ncbi:MAG: carbamoyltransferase [Deltaproteobacteria bacterium]|nr:carbamoyltransferase [Deltaproteobacteria bacterium]
MYILGISAYYHDSAACLLFNGKIIAAAQEERFSRKKHDPRFPENAVKYCLKEAGIKISEIKYIVFYDKPFLTFERLLETYLSYAPRGAKSFLESMPVWLKQKLHMRKEIINCINELGESDTFQGDLLFSEHHESHASSAFFPSPYEEAAILTLDGVGEWTTTSYGVGRGNTIEFLNEIHFPHSLGLLYSAFTYYTGFKVNSGEYKVMGLAPYGEPKYVDLILKELVDVKDDGSFRLNMEYFNYCSGLTMTSKKFHKLFGSEPRKPETKLTQREMDLARSVQDVTEYIVLKIARHIAKTTKMENLCLAGGVALNCVANGKILEEGIFKNIWIQPAAGDAGGCIGAALAVWHRMLGNKRFVNNKEDLQSGSYLGPEYEDEEIEAYLKENNVPFKRYSEHEISIKGAEILASEKVVGWFSGRMEFGPRALGGRSIIGDARSLTMQSTMNLKIKFRESFRPFAPSVLREKTSEYFELDTESPYMLLVAPVKKNKRKEMSDDEKKLFGIDKLNVCRSEIPAITHVDYSARIQTVEAKTNPAYYNLIKEFYNKTGCPVIINTSFNVRGEPIVNTLDDAYRCFMRTNMDYLVLGNFILDKVAQPKYDDDEKWKDEFELD